MKLLLFAFASFVTSTCYGIPIVRVREGELLGTTYTLPNDRDVFVFYRIPYAQPPIGPNRFREPNPPKPWSGIRAATAAGNACAQVPYIPGHKSKPIGDEDCLFVNVYTPKLPERNMRSKLMNVLVYIHGGAFTFGASNEAHPDYILQDDDIVYVTMNYRLGVLGFFSANHTKAPGNNGLKDQVEALRWIKRNIRSFGGDPNKITLYGMSAGAASVHYQMISPSSDGLFQSAITSSGTISLPWTLPPNVVNTSLDVARSLKCYSKDVEMMMNCLRQKPIKQIIEKGYEFMDADHVMGFPYGPVIEPKHPGAFLSENPYTLLKNGKVKNIPWLTSITRNEGSTLGIEIDNNATYMSQVEHQWNELIPKLFSYDYLPLKSKRDDISAAIRMRYLGGDPLTENTMPHLMQALGDRHFYHGITTTTKLHSKAIPENTFCFKFYYRGSESYSDFFPNPKDKDYGVCHGDDVLYVIKSPKGKFKTETDLKISKLICSTIIAFMKYADPSTRGIQWPSISKDGTMNCLAIHSYNYQEIENVEDPDSIRFWNDLLPSENPDNIK